MSGKEKHVISLKDLVRIKEIAGTHFERQLPRGLSAETLQIWLICQGFADFLYHKKVVEEKIEFER